MNAPSEFQKKYPLSPRKFWKKMIAALLRFLLPIIVVIVALTVSLSAIYFSTPDAYNPNVSSANDAVYTAVGFFILGAAFLLVILVVFFVIYGLYIKAYIKRYYYDCGDQLVTIQKKVFTPTEIHVLYQKIQDVYVDQDILDRIMGLYDVHIASATVTSGIEAHIDGVDQKNAEAIKEFLLNKIQGKSSAAASQPLPSQVSEPVKFQSDKKISSENYPIDKKWIKLAATTEIIVSLLGSAFVLAWLSSFFIYYQSLILMVIVYIFAVAVIFSLLFAQSLIFKKNYYFEFMPDYILLKTGVLSRQEKHLPYKAIQNVTTKQGLIERMFGLATVSIENAAGGMQGNAFVGGGISLLGQPYAKAQELNEILNKITSSQSNPSSMGL